jgi:hypothetical protein
MKIVEKSDTRLTLTSPNWPFSRKEVVLDAATGDLNIHKKWLLIREDRQRVSFADINAVEIVGDWQYRRFAGGFWRVFLIPRRKATWIEEPKISLFHGEDLKKGRELAKCIRDFIRASGYDEIDLVESVEPPETSFPQGARYGMGGSRRF